MSGKDAIARALPYNPPHRNSQNGWEGGGFKARVRVQVLGLFRVWGGEGGGGWVAFRLLRAWNVLGYGV